MKLTSSEDRGEVDEEGKLDIVKKSYDSKWKYDNSEIANQLKTQATMGKTDNTKDDVGVDEITNGVESCRIAENGSSAHELTGELEKLSIHERVDKEEAEKKPVTAAATQQKYDSDETDNNEEEEENEDSAVESPLVRLAPPCFEESEEVSDNDQEKGTGTGGTLVNRGPMHGIPSNFEVEGVHNYMIGKSYTLYGSVNYAGHMNNLSGDFCGTMPQNFPNYGNYNQRSAVSTLAEQGRNTKRGRDEREMYHEPPKYVRPQNAGLLVQGDMTSLTKLNNLNAPGSGNGGNTVCAGKKVSSSTCLRQMSGGTVVTTDNTQLSFSADQIMNGMTGATGNYGDGYQNMGYQQGCIMLDRQDSIGLPDIWDISPSEPGLNIPVDVEDFFPENEPSAGNLHMTGQTQNSMTSRQQQQIQQGPLPPVSTLTNSSATNYQFQSQQVDKYAYGLPQQSSVDSGTGKRDSFSNNQEDVGYISDLSPTHDPQFPPTPSPSPQSIMEASPAPSHGSPRATSAWSPPPSNMSTYSGDSGICSPMSDDQSGYITQVKSPRQFVKSPPGLTQQTGVLGSSPPHHQMMSPPQQIGSPAQMQHSPASSFTSEIPEVSENYFNSYVTNHLEDLNSALEVASQDLMNEKFKRTLVHPQGLRPIELAKTIQRVDNIVVSTSPPASQLPSHQIKNMPPQTINRNVTQGQVNPTKPGLSGNEYPESRPNLPTTVPTTIHTTTNGSRTGQRGKNEISKSLPATAVDITTTSNALLAVNSEGKIPIPPLQQRPRQHQGPSQMVPVFVTSGMPQLVIVPPKTTRRFTPIAPKEDPSKQGDKSTDAKGKSPTCDSPRSTNGDGNNGTVKTSNSPNNGKKPGTSPTTLLNLARRLVAEMSTSDVKYKDNDGDTYLHVAVCKADHFMVQALLERLVREHLSEMIDVQNSMGQTPLYLAVSTSHAKMVQLLVERGADVNPFAERELPSGACEKSAAIHCASSKGSKEPKYLDTLKALLKAPEINLNQVNSEGHTALHCAILAHKKVEADGSLLNSIPIIQALIPAGADPNLQVQQSGKTALMYALESRDIDLIESVFQLVDPAKLPSFLKTQAFDGKSCQKIAESLKSSLDTTSQHRLYSCLRPRPQR